ncbi:DUF6188 family protein [Kitasatospora sp. CB01950]|uniref:DUF6188 family protein n=1 Tax=Kitasatospora sp. CB01950 TaxID=1703930 RepID=UPI00093F3BEB|nr:DUF6188 family protein [Kitasatospora sp. CB01950]OKJ13636.1 hypothetical protein AMK19_09300 [Kitasatospora sp. CB01950]
MERATGTGLGLDGCAVLGLGGGDRLVLHLDGGLRLTVRNDFRLLRGAEVDHFYPALGVAPAGALGALSDATVTAATVTPAGGLRLAFDTGHTLAVAPDPGPGGPVHPWQLASPAGLLFTGGPDGGPAL